MGRIITFFSFLLIVTSIHAQIEKDIQTFKDSIKRKYNSKLFKNDVRELYKDSTLIKKYIDNALTKKELLKTYGDSLFIKFQDDKLIHYKALNILFNKEINKLLTEASDLSTRSAFATLEEENNRLTLGYAFSPENATSGGTDYINTIWSMGIEADIEDNFSSLSVDSEIQNNIGVFVKFTKLFGGSIFFDPGREIHRFRNNYLLHDALNYKYKEYEEPREEKIELAVQKELSLDPMLTKIDENDPAFETAYKAAYKKAYATAMEKEFNQTVKKAFNETLNYELETVNQKEYINAFSKMWLSGRVYMPISTTEYEVFKEETSPSSETKSFYPLALEGSFSYYRKSMRYGTWQFTGMYNGFMNNSIEANIIKERTFTSLPNNTPTAPVELSTQNKYIGEFDSFITHNLKADFIYFPFNFFVGVSASFDYSLGEYEASTWKLGIPFYLKGKNDDSAISVELQWREIHEKTLSGESTHALGFSIGIPFGNYVNQ